MEFLYGVAFTLLIETAVLIYATEKIRRKLHEENDS